MGPPRRSGTPSCGRRTCPSTRARQVARAPTTTSRSCAFTKTSSPPLTISRLRTVRRSAKSSSAHRSRRSPMRTHRIVPKSAQSYANAPEQEAARFHDGWLYIGDLATWDENEYVTIVGRKDDMIISGGENVHPVQVEEVLNEHPGIQDALVVSVPDSTWGERVVAFIVPDEESLTATDCDRHCRDHSGLADFKRPRAYRFVDSLPLTATGKKVHYRAREQAIEEFDQGLFELVDSA